MLYMPIYWINTKGKGFSDNQIAAVERKVDNCDFAIANYDPSRQAIHVAVLGDHSASSLPVLPNGLVYEESFGD